MAEIHDLNVADASNTARFPENMAPSAVNDGARALEGLIARWFFDKNCSLEATLSGSLLTVTANRNSLTLTGTTSNYVADTMIGFRMGSAGPNTGPLRLIVDGIAAKELRDNKGASLTSSVLLDDTRGLAVYDGTNGYWRLVWPEQVSGGYTDPLSTRGDLLYRTAVATDRLALGAAGSFPASDGTDVAYQAMATQAEQETGTSVVAPVTPGRQHYHPSHPKAWCRVRMSSTMTLIASSGVATITDGGTGNIRVDFSTVFSSENYIAVGMAEKEVATAESTHQLHRQSFSVSFYRTIVNNDGAAAVDCDVLAIAFWGDQ